MNININENLEKKDYRNLFLIFSLIYTLIIISLFVPIFAYIVFIVSGIFIFSLKLKYSIPILFYLLPFSGIMKYSSDSPSFFSYLIIIFIFIFFLRNINTRFKYKNFIALFIFIIINCLNNFDIIRMLNIIIGSIVLFIILYKMTDSFYKYIIIIFAISILLSSIIAIFEPYIPRLDYLLRFIPYWTEEGIKTFRFCGLEGDPNYYAVNIILILTALNVLLYKNHIKERVYYLLTIPLILFGFLTLSKSFIIMLFLYFVMYIIMIFKKDKIKSIYILFFIFLLTIIGINVIGFNVIILTINRLIGGFSNGLDLNILLTGRLVIWENYWLSINESIFTLLFGHGLKASYYLGVASHSIYFESLYHFGFIGTFLLIINFILISHIVKKKFTNKLYLYSPMVFLLILLIALDMLKTDKIYFYLSLVISVLYVQDNTNNKVLSEKFLVLKV